MRGRSTTCLEVPGAAGRDRRESKAALEATYGWECLGELFEDAGYELHLAHPLRTKAIPAARVKTESVDARTLAHLLRADLLPEAYMAPPELSDLREPLRHRWVLVRLRASLKCPVPCADRPPGILPPYGELFGKAGGRFLSELELRDVHRGRLDGLLSLIADLDREVEVAPARSRSGPKETSASGC